MAVVQLEVPEHLVISKKRQRNRLASGKGQGTNRTLTSEVKSWLSECAQAHWFLCQPFQIGSAAYNPRRSLPHRHPECLLINFHDAKDAALFKLTWL